MTLTIETYEKRLENVKKSNYYYDIAHKTLALIRYFKNQHTCEAFVNLSYMHKALDTYAEIEIIQKKDKKYEYNIRSLQFPSDVQRKIEIDYRNRISYLQPDRHNKDLSRNTKEKIIEK